jgi:hypothetical protein
MLTVKHITRTPKSQVYHQKLYITNEIRGTIKSILLERKHAEQLDSLKRKPMSTTAYLLDSSTAKL